MPATRTVNATTGVTPLSGITLATGLKSGQRRLNADNSSSAGATTFSGKPCWPKDVGSSHNAS